MPDPTLTCIHRAAGLCPSCQAERDADEDAWREFGRHAEGEARWRALQDEIAADAARTPPVAAGDSEIPF